MKENHNSIMELLNARQSERKAEIAAFNNEMKKTKEKIAELTAQQEAAEQPEEFKRAAQDLNSMREYLTFLEKRAKTPRGPIISKEEYNEIEAALSAENEKTLDAKAPQILKKFTELLSLLTEYTDSAEEMQKVLNTAQNLHYGKTMGGHYWHSLKDRTPDAFSYFARMYDAYLKQKSLIEQVKKSPRRSLVDAEAARLYDVVNKRRAQ